LMGKSFSVAKQREIMDVLRSRPSVLSIHDMKTVTYGENDSRFKAEIQFHGRQLAKQVLYGPPPEIGEFWRRSDLVSDQSDPKSDSLPFPRRRAVLPNTDGALAGRLLLQLLQKSDRPALTKRDAEDLLLRFGDEIVQEVGREVDSVERMMKMNFPFITHVDLESHVPSFVPQEDEYHSASYHNKYVNGVLTGDGVTVTGYPNGVSASPSGPTGDMGNANAATMGSNATYPPPERNFDTSGPGNSQSAWNSTAVGAKAIGLSNYTDSRSYASSYYQYVRNIDELPVFAVDNLFAEHVHYKRRMANIKMNPQALAEHISGEEDMYMKDKREEEDQELAGESYDLYRDRNEYPDESSNASSYYDATDVVRREEKEEWERTSY